MCLVLGMFLVSDPSSSSYALPSELVTSKFHNLPMFKNTLLLLFHGLVDWKLCQFVCVGGGGGSGERPNKTVHHSVNGVKFALLKTISSTRILRDGSEPPVATTNTTPPLLLLLPPSLA